jgi:O-antigen/teichoic acid export membrane protein
VTGEDEETPNQRLTRNINELLSELRVAQAGVQILFGFLLSVVFTAQFREASGFEKGMHLTAVILAATATALLTAPAAWHRVLFRGGRRYEILEVGNRAVLAGLACLASAVTVTVSLIAKVVYGPIAMATVGGLVGLAFALLWFLVPQLIAHR